MTGSVYRTDVLRLYRLRDARSETKLARQFNPRLGLQAVEDQVLLDLAVGDQPVAMRPVATRKDPVGCNGFPKSGVILRFQPVRNVFNVFKNNHHNRIPHHCFETQIFEVRRAGQ